VKALVLATLVGGAGGLYLGQWPEDHRSTWIAEARRGLTGDAQTADLDRALAAVGHVLESGVDVEAQDLRRELEHQKHCREAFDVGEHRLANHERDGAEAAFTLVAGADCRLSDFARTRLEQIHR
jgi:hypothetical protein